MIKFLSTGRYIPDAAGAVYNVLKEMSQFQASKKQRYEEQDTDLLKKVYSRTVTKETLTQMLAQHVEKVSSSFKLCFNSKHFRCPGIWCDKVISKFCVYKSAFQ